MRQDRSFDTAERSRGVRMGEGRREGRKEGEGGWNGPEVSNLFALLSSAGMKEGVGLEDLVLLYPSEVRKMPEPTATAERGVVEVEKKEEEGRRVGVDRVMDARGKERRRLSIN